MTIEETREHLQRLIQVSQNMIDSGAAVVPDMLSKDIECYKKAIEILDSHKTGNWIINANGNVNCDQCGFERSFNSRSNYCPKCGAFMKTSKDKHCDILDKQCMNAYIDCTECEIQLAYDMGRSIMSNVTEDTE